MLEIANDGVDGAWCALSHQSCAVSSVIPLCRVIAPENHARERSVARAALYCVSARFVGHDNAACSHILQVPQYRVGVS
jgi:hypothetical protein